jgi:signal transduction histidine kinase
VADEIMHLHGGDLFIDSKLGEGTKVTIALPKEKQA